MGKNTEIKLVGQPILGQILGLVDKWSFKQLVKGRRATIITRHSRAGLILLR
jgi:hypothetical protein